MHHQGRVVSRTELTEHLYDQDFDRDSNIIEVFIGRLRKKLGVDLIETARGLGYRLRAARRATPERGGARHAAQLARLPPGRERRALVRARAERAAAICSRPCSATRSSAISTPGSAVLLEGLVAGSEIGPERRAGAAPAARRAALHQPLSGWYWQITRASGRSTLALALGPALPVAALAAGSTPEDEASPASVAGPTARSCGSWCARSACPGRRAPLLYAVAGDRREIQAQTRRFDRLLSLALGVLFLGAARRAAAAGPVRARAAAPHRGARSPRSAPAPRAGSRAASRPRSSRSRTSSTRCSTTARRWSSARGPTSATSPMA